MLTLIVALAISLTLNVVFVGVIITALFRSKSSSSTVSSVNVTMRSEISRPAPAPPKAVDIYALVDPNDGRIKYVGQSVDVQKRISYHLREALISGAKSKWLFELYTQGQLPTVKIVASGLPSNQARTFEKQYIRECISRGEKLFNKESINIVPEAMNRIQIEGRESSVPHLDREK
jgi:hypothetical protein